MTPQLTGIYDLSVGIDIINFVVNLSRCIGFIIGEILVIKVSRCTGQWSHRKLRSIIEMSRCIHFDVIYKVLAFVQTISLDVE